MTQPTTKSQQSRSMVAQATVMTVMATGFLVFFSIPGQFERMQERFDSRPLWLTLVLTSFPLVLLVVALWTRKTPDPSRGFNVGLVLATLPGAAATLLHRLVEPDPTWLGIVRAIGIMAMVCVLFGSLVILGRRYVELDRLLFTEATSLAFFATLVVAAAYAALENYADLPRLSYAWIPVIGLGIWGVCALVVKRRLS